MEWPRSAREAEGRLVYSKLLISSVSNSFRWERRLQYLVRNYSGAHLFSSCHRSFSDFAALYSGLGRQFMTWCPTYELERWRILDRDVSGGVVEQAKIFIVRKGPAADGGRLLM